MEVDSIRRYLESPESLCIHEYTVVAAAIPHHSAVVVNDWMSHNVSIFLLPCLNHHHNLPHPPLIHKVSMVMTSIHPSKGKTSRTASQTTTTSPRASLLNTSSYSTSSSDSVVAGSYYMADVFRMNFMLPSRFCHDQRVCQGGQNIQSNGRTPHDVVIMEQLDHTNIIRMLDVYSDDCYVFIVLELHGKTRFPKCPELRQLYPDGDRSLSGYLMEHHHMSAKDAFYVLSQLVDAVDHLHLKGFVHCDIKPSNILIDGDLKVKLIDFCNVVIPRVSKDWDQKDGPVFYLNPSRTRNQDIRASGNLQWPQLHPEKFGRMGIRYHLV
ncbi:kinase-like domain-containing protein [Irpex rosettiformis]|uniref:Kinase-like domain-containing protein n=1 Tax=Irpex rosettiformis TaxID=378272 RepID=A0ACB8TT90_9APHY|nr:kinase-like domain-containing protein [Irpex rosettiformis]